jgi:hypothetical protein
VRARLAALLLPICALSLCACGSDSSQSTVGQTTRTPTSIEGIAARPAPRGCAATVARTLGEVAERINRAANTGSNVGEAVGRVRASKALRASISADDAGATRAALQALLLNQIARIQVLKGGRVFAAAGSGPAIAPVRGSIPTTGASFVLSVQAADSYLQVTRQVTGAEVALDTPFKRIAATTAALPPLARLRRSGPLRYGGRRYETTSVAGSAFPSGLLRISLLVGAAHLTCPGAAEQTRVETLGHVGERIYREEAGSPYVIATRRHIEADSGFQQAVAARDNSAIRAAIVRFFGAHIHVVRVRAYAVEPSGAQRFLYDLGGPYVLAPVHGNVRSGGKLVGRFSFAIQDDAGYLRLAHLFTGAEVLMRVGPNAERRVMGTLDPGPAKVPHRGTVRYRGKSYQAYSFTGEAFPSGPLRISLLTLARPPIEG